MALNWINEVYSLRYKDDCVSISLYGCILSCLKTKNARKGTSQKISNILLSRKVLNFAIE